MARNTMGTKATLWVDEWRNQQRLFIQSPYILKEAVGSLPGAFWDGSRKAWHIPASPSLWNVVESTLDGLDLLTDAATDTLRVDAERQRQALSTKSAEGLSGLPVQTRCMNYSLPCPTVTGEQAPFITKDYTQRTVCPHCGSEVGSWLHQRRAFHFLKSMRAGAMWIDMGGGKSLATIALLDEWACKQVLIVCPKSVTGVWPKQFKAHSLRQWDVYTPPSAAPVPKRAEGAFKHLIRPTGAPKCLVLNYDSIWRNVMSNTLLSMEWDVIVYDESHKLKSPGGKTSKFAHRLHGKTSRVLLLSGTPDPNNFADIYAQYRAADPGIYGTSYSRFKRRFAHVRQIGNNPNAEKIEGFRDDRAKDEFAKKLASISITVTRDEMNLDVPTALPPVTRYAPLKPASFKVYQEIKHELVSEVKEGIVSADNALTKLMRLRQITSGYVRTEDGIDSIVGEEKKQLLAEVLDDLPPNKPIVVFAVFHHDLDNIRSVAEERGLIYGELSGRRRDGLAEDSTMAEGIDILGTQLQSGGVGIDLTRSSYGIYYSIDHNRGNIVQSRARLDRPGQRFPVTFIDLVITTPVGGQTVDGATLKALEDKRKLSETLYEALRRNEL